MCNAKCAACIAALMLAVVFLGACGTSGEDNGKINIVTTLYPPYDFACQVAGDNADVTMLLSPGEESHSFDPTPKDVIRIAKCDLFICNGGENEEWVGKVLDAAGGNVRVLRMMDVVDTVYAEEIVEGMEGGSPDGDDAEYDEHVWASIDNAIQIVRAIERELARIDSAHEEEYSARAGTYVDELSDIRDKIAATVKDAERNCLVFGDRFPMRYFTEEFGLSYSAAFPGCSSDTEANAATIRYLIDRIRDDNIPVVLKCEMSSGNIAETIAEETGAEVLTMYACHNISREDFQSKTGYAGLMKRNLAALKEALF